MQHIIVGTAGHIDHGKTSLVKALTGIDTDRLEEEKRRGISIDIGFASVNLNPNLRLAFIDVPGHERFVKNMLAGVAGIDLVLLVIAADDSIMADPRTLRYLSPPRHSSRDRCTHQMRSCRFRTARSGAPRSRRVRLPIISR